MKKNNTQKEWMGYRDKILSVVTPILKEQGFTIEKEQPHILGERFLMHAVTTTSGRKLILLGNRVSDNIPVIIKVSDDPAGILEIEHERMLREKLHTINFAYDVFYSPEEFAYLTENGIVIAIQRFITQKSTFLERPIAEQFSLALRAFKAQESVHATTGGHISGIKKIFERYNAKSYINTFTKFQKKIALNVPKDKRLETMLGEVMSKLTSSATTIEQYCGFLTHTDFVPHNIRVQDGLIYLLDFSSLRFGNKYEGWARFLNFMTLYNPELERAFVTYVKDNRAQEEQEALHLMRLYRLGEIICYYTSTLSRSTGDLLELNTLRIEYWTDVLDHTLKNETVPEELRQAYISKRDVLRSDEEKDRQRKLH